MPAVAHMVLSIKMPVRMHNICLQF